MDELFYSSKDEIRNRMLRHAREYWGIQRTADLDPMVKLLLEALSTELFNISSEVKGLEQRMIDKVSTILASDTLTTAIPAHAVLHARPVEAAEVIDERTAFVYNKRLADRDASGESSLDLFFSPLKPTRIFRAALQYMASGKNLFQLDNEAGRTSVAQCMPGRALENHTLYLGIALPSDLQTLEGLSFYFDWRNYKVEKQAYDLLGFAKWFCAGTPLQVAQDRFYETSLPARRSPFDEHSIANLVTRDVLSFYRNRFYTVIDAGQTLPAPEDYPDTFNAVFPAAMLQRLKGALRWIRIELPASINDSLLDELSVSINAFPVVNKKRHDLKHRLKVMSDIIPLKLTDHEQFLSVDNLKDIRGNLYTEIPQGYDEERNAGLFAVRYGGAERFDKRNAREVLDHLFELLRDEKAAFAAYGSDFLHSSLKELEQQISMISQKTTGQQVGIRELLNYIVFKPLPNAEIMFLQYWSTNAELANQVKAGTRLQAFENSAIAAESVYLLSTSAGGRSRLNAANRARAYKYGLTTADRIVTQEDIVNFCWWEFGDNITAVNIRKGLVASGLPKQGFIRTVDIYLTPAASAALKAADWQSMLDLAHAKLLSRSTMHTHYRLLLTPDND